MNEKGTKGDKIGLKTSLKRVITVAIFSIFEFAIWPVAIFIKYCPNQE